MEVLLRPGEFCRNSAFWLALKSEKFKFDLQNLHENSIQTDGFRIVGLSAREQVVLAWAREKGILRERDFHQVKLFRRGHMRDQTGLKPCPLVTGERIETSSDHAGTFGLPRDLLRFREMRTGEIWGNVRRIQSFPDRYGSRIF